MDRIEKVLVFVVVATIVVIVTLALSNSGDDTTGDSTTGVGGDGLASLPSGEPGSDIEETGEEPGGQNTGGQNSSSGQEVNISPPVVIPPAVLPQNRTEPAPIPGPDIPANEPGGSGYAGLPGPTPTPAKKPAPASAKRTYVVKKDDSLWKIAEKHYGQGKYWEQVRDANPGKVGDRGALRLNTTLVLPDIKREAIAETPTRLEIGNYRTLKLKKGEWLYKVLRREGLTSRKKEILKLNGITEAEARDLKAGFELKLPLK